MPYNHEAVYESVPDFTEQPQAIQASSEHFVRWRRVISKIGVIAAAATAVIGLGTAMGVATEMADPAPKAAYADDGGYPYAKAPCLSGDPKDPNSSYGKTEGTGYWCYDYNWGESEYGFGKRNCVDWGAFRAQQITGVVVPYGAKMGNAADWDNNAPTYGFSVGNTPQRGDIGVKEATATNKYGHVVVVEKVNPDGTIDYSDYNSGLNGAYAYHASKPANTFGSYIDLTPNKNEGQDQTQKPRKAPNDWDHDGRSDVVVWRPSDGGWYIRGYSNTWYGLPGDRPVAGDWNNDGRYDPAVYRPSDSTWHMQDINDFVYGKPGDLPVPADWNRDGRLEAAVWRPTTGEWFGRGIGWLTSFGLAGDVPVAGDWNGDGFPEVALYRPSTQEWMVQGSPNSRFGEPGDVPMPADWNGDGKLEAAVWRPSDGGWHIQGVADFPYGHPGDIPTWGDWDGNGAIDATVIEPTDPWTWCVRGGGYAQWGKPGDVVVMAVN